MIDLSRRIAETDSLVWKNVSIKFPDLSREIDSIIKDCELLWGGAFSIFLAGSLSFCSRTSSFQKIDLESGKSDVDIWIIVRCDPLSVSFLPGYIEAYQKLLDYDLATLSVKSQYDMSIKVMKEETFLSLTAMLRNSITVHRKK